MISNVQEPRGGTAWSVHILGCHSRRARSAHPKKNARLREKSGSAWRNCGHVAKIREHARAAAQGQGSR